MNRQRRKVIAAICAKLQALEIEISEVAEEEQEAFDNLPEPFQESERGEKMYEAIEELETVCNEIEEIRNRLEEL